MRSSTAITARDRDGIRNAVRRTVEKSKRVLHSPARSTDGPVHAVHLVLPVHVSLFLRGRVNVRARRSVRRDLWRARARLHPGTGGGRRPLIYVRDFGRFRPAWTGGAEAWCWVGAAFLRLTGGGWCVADVTEPCRVVVDYLDGGGAPVRRVNVYTGAASFGAGRAGLTAGRVTMIRVERVGTCFRRVSGPLDGEVVRHWAPFSRVIYAACGDVPPGGRVLARIDSANGLHCLYCRRGFGRSVKALCSHLGLPPGTLFETHVTR